jgi:hypothetical protein
MIYYAIGLLIAAVIAAIVFLYTDDKPTDFGEWAAFAFTMIAVIDLWPLAVACIAAVAIYERVRA